MSEKSITVSEMRELSEAHLSRARSAKDQGGLDGFAVEVQLETLTSAVWSLGAELCERLERLEEKDKDGTIGKRPTVVRVDHANAAGPLDVSTCGGGE